MKQLSVCVSLILLMALSFQAVSASIGIGGDQGYFEITSTPSGAEVHFDGQYKGTTPITIPVYTTGTPQHTISLSLEGYQPWAQSYTGNPSAGETIPIHANLVYIPVTEPTTSMPGSGKGYYAISSSPSGASVYFDNRYQGTTPVTVEVSTTGTPGHTIRITLSGYQDWTSMYPGNPADGQTIQVMAYLTPVTNYGSISVDSSPTQATAVLDGASSQVTPCTFYNVYPGTHTLQITKSGYQTWSSTVAVSAGINTPVSVTLQSYSPDTGTIYAITTPQGASLYVDGVYYGPTPQLATNLVPGYHQVRLSLSGFQDWVGQVQVISGRTTTVSQTLSVEPTTRPTQAPGTGLLSISSSPAGAQVYVDNAYTGITPLTTPPVTAGSHQVLVRLSGYADWQTTVNVNAGQTVPVEAILSPVPVTTKSAPAPALAVISFAILVFMFRLRKE